MPPFHRSINRAISRRMQKTKVSITINGLSFAASTRTDFTIASASDTTRANYFDTYVKPFAKIQQMEVDIQIYQSGATVAADGFVYWAFWKSPGGAIAPANAVCNSTGLTFVPFTFRKGLACVPVLTSTSAPSIYHLHGIIKIPKRLQTMAPGDILYLSVLSGPGAGSTYSVAGNVNYMFKV